jgi:hypothetical protein
MRILEFVQLGCCFAIFGVTGIHANHRLEGGRVRAAFHG